MWCSYSKQVAESIIIIVPLSQYTSYNSHDKTITYVHIMQVVLVGDEMGAVSVYLIRNLPAAPNDQVTIKLMYFCVSLLMANPSHHTLRTLLLKIVKIIILLPVIIVSSYTGALINPRCVGGLGYSSLSFCLCVRVSVAQFGLPGDLGITILYVALTLRLKI